jgi:hypothetical protein
VSAARTPGTGDRWMAGEAIPGVAFAMHARVRIVGGSRDGQTGSVALLVGLAPEPGYLVTLDGGGDLKVRQSALRALD